MLRFRLMTAMLWSDAGACLFTKFRLSAGGLRACALWEDRQVLCWGSSYFGQLGNGETTNQSTPVTVVGVQEAVAVSAGDLHTCALREGGQVVCWGAGGHGQLGNGHDADHPSPVPVVGWPAE